MQHTTISGHRQAHYTTTALWIVAGIVAVVALGDAVTVLAIVVAIVATARWLYREVEQRWETSDAQVAPVTHLSPESAGRHEWRGPRAA